MGVCVRRCGRDWSIECCGSTGRWGLARATSRAGRRRVRRVRRGRAWTRPTRGASFATEGGVFGMSREAHGGGGDDAGGGGAAQTVEDVVRVRLQEHLGGDLVFARASSREREPYWPGVVLEPRDAPPAVRKEIIADAVCVMFFGPSAARGRERDFCWATETRVVPYEENKRVMEAQHVAKRMRPTAFRVACEEAEELYNENGGARLGTGAFGFGDEDDAELPRSSSTPSVSAFGLPCSVPQQLRVVPKCSSCGVSTDEVLAHGAKGRCALCQKLHKEGQFCPVCDRVWHWSTGDPMVGCDRCDMWIHRECDSLAAEVLDKEEENGEECAYSCPSCRSKSDAQRAIERREALEAEHAAKVREELKERRRLEKLLSKKRVGRPSKAMKEAALTLKRSPIIKSPHAASKKQNTIPKRPKSSWQLFAADFFQNYKEKHGEDNIDFAEVYRLQGAAWREIEASERSRYEELATAEAERFREMILDMNARGELDDQSLKRYDKILNPEAYEEAIKIKREHNARDSKASRHTKAGLMSRLPDGSAIPERLEVICNGVLATYLTQLNQVLCMCSDCAGQDRHMSPTEFEKHCGMAQAKKWKTSLRMIEPAKMPIGRFLDGAQIKVSSSDQQKNSPKELDYEIVQVSWSVDRCAVCDDERDFDFDQLITCEACAVTVHQSCYGVPDIPDDTVGWLCRSCEHTGGAVSETPLCCLCPVAGGALKPTTIPSLWAHSACCQWIPETTVLDIERMEPIDNIANIQKERWSLLCTVCKQRMGAKIQCCHPGCYLAYHPLCARATGLYMDANDDGDDDESPLQLLSYCHRHCRVDTERALIYSGAEGLKIGEEGRLVQCGANKQRKQKAAKVASFVVDVPVQENPANAAVNEEESELSSDSEYDPMMCAKFRPYVRQGHPRTEADVKDENDDAEPGSAAKPVRIRKRVLHANVENDDDVDNGVGDDDDADDDDADDDDEVDDDVEEPLAEVPNEAAEEEDGTEEEGENVDETESDAMSTDEDTADGAFPSNMKRINEDAFELPMSKKAKVDAPSESTFPGKPISVNMDNAKKPVNDYIPLPGGLPVPEDNIPRPEVPEMRVRCKTFKGIFRPADTYIRCLCGKCKRDAKEANSDAPALWQGHRWEAHCGMKHAKKWKISIKVVPPGDEEKDELDLKNFGEWLDENNIVVVAGSSKRRPRPLLPGMPVRRKYTKNSRGANALIGLGLGTFESDRTEDKMDEESKAGALVGRSVRVNIGSVIIPKWMSGSIVDYNVSRTGCRHKVLFEDGNDQMFTFTRDGANLQFTDGDAPDLSFLPEPEKMSAQEIFQHKVKKAISQAQFPSAKRPSSAVDRAKITELGRPKKPREKEAWVQCENPSCGKWRRVPHSFAEQFSADDADMWTCEKNPQQGFAVCSVPQEFEDDEIDRRIALGDDAPFMDGSDDDDDGDEDTIRVYVPDDLPACVSVICQAVLGVFHLQTRKVECLCSDCTSSEEGSVFHQITDYGAHCGVSTKKWRENVRVILKDGNVMQLGKWLAIWGCEIRREKYVDTSDKSLIHSHKLSRKQLEEIQRNVYKRLGLSKIDKNATVSGPPPKTGKRQYVELTPYVVRGTRGCFKRELIPSKKYTPEEFVAIQTERKNRGGDAPVVEQQGMPMREKLEQMTATYSERLTFAKSNIHGWGLVAKAPMKAGSIVTQFKGETCRSTVADLREARYEEAGVDCYLLKQDDDTVVDCTFQGNFARFTNHSCNPNMYSKIVKVDQDNHIIFFARNDIKAGEELTYNYRFESEDGKVPCYCGAHNCRGYLC